jgi:hypothetical protein
MLPKAIVIVRVSGHQGVNFMDAQGNKANKAALHLAFKMLRLAPDFQEPSLNPFSLPWRRFN